MSLDLLSTKAIIAINIDIAINSEANIKGDDVDDEIEIVE